MIFFPHTHTHPHAHAHMYPHTHTHIRKYVDHSCPPCVFVLCFCSVRLVRVSASFVHILRLRRVSASCVPVVRLGVCMRWVYASCSNRVSAPRLCPPRVRAVCLHCVSGPCVCKHICAGEDASRGKKKKKKRQRERVGRRKSDTHAHTHNTLYHATHHIPPTLTTLITCMLF
jgi:hypothetical protein